MLINIGKMKFGELMAVKFSIKVKIPQEYALLDEEINVDVKGSFKMEGDYFSLKGKASSIIHSECALCLAPIEKILEFEIDDKYSETLETLGTEEVWKIVSKKIDFSNSILSKLLSEIPVKFICLDDCKGLCPFCGIDLNKKTCNCSNEQIDERFAKLKDFFKEV